MLKLHELSAKLLKTHEFSLDRYRLALIATITTLSDGELCELARRISEEHVEHVN